MACTLSETIKKKIIGKATSYVDKGNEIFIPSSEKFTLQQTYTIAKQKVEAINKEYLGDKFGNPTSLNTTYTNGTGINIHITPQLQLASDIRDGKKEFERNIQYFRGDVALMEQEQKELSVEDLYESSFKIDDKTIEDRIKQCE